MLGFGVLKLGYGIVILGFVILQLFRRSPDVSITGLRRFGAFSPKPDIVIPNVARPGPRFLIHQKSLTLSPYIYDKLTVSVLAYVVSTLTLVVSVLGFVVSVLVYVVSALGFTLTGLVFVISMLACVVSVPGLSVGVVFLRSFKN